MHFLVMNHRDRYLILCEQRFFLFGQIIAWIFFGLVVALALCAKNTMVFNRVIYNT